MRPRECVDTLADCEATELTASAKTHVLIYGYATDRGVHYLGQGIFRYEADRNGYSFVQRALVGYAKMENELQATEQQAKGGWDAAFACAQTYDALRRVFPFKIGNGE
jgi:hypothetical protein